MLRLKNSYWTLNDKKHSELNATERLIFNLLFEHRKNQIIELHNKNKTTTFAVNEIEVKNFEILKTN
jgi:hypothetical protein